MPSCNPWMHVPWMSLARGTDLRGSLVAEDMSGCGKLEGEKEEAWGKSELCRRACGAKCARSIGKEPSHGKQCPGEMGTLMSSELLLLEAIKWRLL